MAKSHNLRHRLQLRNIIQNNFKGTVKDPLKITRFLFIIPLIGFFATWELLIRINAVSASSVPPPSAILGALIVCLNDPVFIFRVMQSFLNLTTGIFLALFIALPMAICVGLRNKIDSILTPVIMLCGALPDLALLPLFVYWFGPGGMAAICMASVCSFFPIFFTVREGVKDIPKDYFFVTTVYGAKKFAVYKKLVLPAVFPQLVTGLRLAFDFVWEIVLAIEIMASVAGIGSFISLSVEEGSLENAFAGIIMIGLIAIAIDRVVFQHLEAKIGRWHE